MREYFSESERKELAELLAGTEESDLPIDLATFYLEMLMINYLKLGSEQRKVMIRKLLIIIGEKALSETFGGEFFDDEPGHNT